MAPRVIADTCDSNGLGDTCGEESAHGSDEMYTCVCGTTAPFPRHTLFFARCLEFGLAVVLTMATVSLFQEGGGATGIKGDEDDGMTFLTGEDCEDISYGTSPWAGGSESTSDTSDPDELDEHNMWHPMLELFCHADIGKLVEALADDMVLGIVALTCHFALDILCDPECADVATFDLSYDCTDLTSGDQCNVMSATGYQGSVSTWTRALEVVNGSVSVIGSLPNCTVRPQINSNDFGGFWN